MKLNASSSDQLLQRADPKLAPKVLFIGQSGEPARTFLPTHRALHFLALSVLMMICGDVLHAQQCIFGTGMTGQLLCCSPQCTECFGAQVHPNKGPGSESWKPEAAPCGCVWQTGGSCPPVAAAQKFVSEEYAQKYQSRPMLFHGCNGSILWALRTGRPEGLELRERRASIVPAG